MEKPKKPTTPEETGLGVHYIADMVLKILFQRGVVAGRDIADELHVPFPGVVEPAMDYLKDQHFVDTKAGSGARASFYLFSATSEGINRARQVMEQNEYIGALPVPFDSYVEKVKEQSIHNAKVGPEALEKAFAHIKIPQSLKDTLGPSVNSGRSLFLYGPPGNGKTTIAEAITTLLGDEVFLPHAIIVDGQIIKIFDMTVHTPCEVQPDGLQQKKASIADYDTRWIPCKRPMVMAGGELTLDVLDLIYDPTTKFYIGPLQLKANMGIFMIDDFGRQLVSPRDLLNRWIVPLESAIDFMTLHNGKKFKVPFDQLIIFSTNLDPADLVDDAFLRRIRYKALIGPPDRETFKVIFRVMAKKREVEYDEDLLEYLLVNHYENQEPERERKGCHPRDLIDQAIDYIQYEDLPMKLTENLMDKASASYFAKM